ncbi:hypothetical protein FGB62_5g021 [Gracilaria domingensis]|nr:hypothetical protein FGB62_5g021 [Gracilaria domingensis]
MCHDRTGGDKRVHVDGPVWKWGNWEGCERGFGVVDGRRDQWLNAAFLEHVKLVICTVGFCNMLEDCLQLGCMGVTCLDSECEEVRHMRAVLMNDGWGACEGKVKELCARHRLATLACTDILRILRMFCDVRMLVTAASTDLNAAFAWRVSGSNAAQEEDEGNQSGVDAGGEKAFIAG